MTDTLRTRIAYAIAQADGDMPGMEPDSHDRHLADAVIAELALTQQFLVDGIISDGEPRPWELPCDTRYATEWERFDE